MCPPGTNRASRQDAGGLSLKLHSLDVACSIELLPADEEKVAWEKHNDYFWGFLYGTTCGGMADSAERSLFPKSAKIATSRSTETTMKPALMSFPFRSSMYSVRRRDLRPFGGITSVVLPTSFPLRSTTSMVALACAALGLTSAIPVKKNVSMDATCAKTASETKVETRGSAEEKRLRPGSPKTTLPASRGPLLVIST